MKWRKTISRLTNSSCLDPGTGCPKSNWNTGGPKKLIQGADCTFTHTKNACFARHRNWDSHPLADKVRREGNFSPHSVRRVQSESSSCNAYMTWKMNLVLNITWLFGTFLGMRLLCVVCEIVAGRKVGLYCAPHSCCQTREVLGSRQVRLDLG